YKAAAQALGRSVAQHGARLIYGGAAIGLMGTTAQAALDAGGEVIGVIPQFLRAREVELTTLTELIITVDMHQRKEQMHKLSDAFVVLPGGIGTLEEVTEALTWSQLGLHKKPVIFVNIDGFWDPLFALFDRVANSNFARYGLKELYQVVNTAEDVMPLILGTKRQAAE
ncbi:MAG TPA: TIGR00730 family Rossman fold protein, partial [Alphaproteobacteria bacterium]|nr:TIGR00730 family Rossman fold protein [Alphaproteobacteria bacterium]